jgi:hypothetical protein
MYGAKHLLGEARERAPVRASPSMLSKCLALYGKSKLYSPIAHYRAHACVRKFQACHCIGHICIVVFLYVTAGPKC